MGVVVISIDGGGVRGVIPARILDKIGLKTNEVSLVTGTSVGSIIASGFNFLPPRDTVDLLCTESKNIFENSILDKMNSGNGVFKAKYDIKNLKQVLRRTFGTKFLAECKIPTLIPAYNITKDKSKIFKSFQDDIPIVDVCASSCSAPTYFIPNNLVGDRMVDGGIYANNPTIVGTLEAIRMFPNERISVLSLGCGFSKNSIKIENGGVIEWTPNLIDLFTNSQQNLVDYVMENLISKIANINYLRLQTELNEKIPLDSVEDIPKLIRIADQMFVKNINNIADFLNKI